MNFSRKFVLNKPYICTASCMPIYAWRVVARETTLYYYIGYRQLILSHVIVHVLLRMWMQACLALLFILKTCYRRVYIFFNIAQTVHKSGLYNISC